MKKQVLLSCGMPFDNKGGIQKGVQLRTKLLCSEFDLDLLLFHPVEETVLRNEFPHIRSFYYFEDRKDIGKLDNCRRLYRFADSFFDQHEYDTVHCHDTRIGGIVLAAAKKHKITTRVLSAHSSKILVKNQTVIQQLFIYITTKNALRNANRLIGVSRIACDDVFGKRKDTKVFYNGIDLSIFDKSKYPKDDTKDTIDFVHVGRFTPQKNHKFIIDTFNLIKTRFPNIRLTLIGYGPLEEDIKKQISDLQLNNCIAMLPPDTYVPEAMGKADYMIFPSLFEGLSNVAMEAMSMNVMCFGSDCLTREIETLGLWKALPLSAGPKGWAEYICGFMEEHKNNRPTVNEEELAKFDVKNTVKRYADLYNGLEI
ncbi:MAG: glycosyltransferase [Abditibacteriota bacterium]|nr:glycosyltransferase [Abditibacteriota bacterium]